MSYDDILDGPRYGPVSQEAVQIMQDRARGPNKSVQMRDEEYANRLIWPNILAGLFHILSGIGIVFFLSFSNDPEEQRKGLLVQDKLTSPDSVSHTTLDRYSLSPILITIPFTTAIAHLVQLLFILSKGRLFTGYRYYLNRGVNAIRWIEYSITASLMTWLIAQLAGVTNVFLVITHGIIANILLQWTGWKHSYARAVAPKDWWLVWPPFIMGSAIFAWQWVTFIYYFSAAAIEAGEDGLPWYVPVAFFTTFIMYILFAVVTLLRTLGRILDTNYKEEIANQVLSFVSKAALDWIVALGIGLAVAETS